MHGVITFGQPYPFLLVGYFGVSPKYRVLCVSGRNQLLQNRRVFSVMARSKDSLVLAQRLHFPSRKWSPGKGQRRT
jgi:hypothetical protein